MGIPQAMVLEGETNGRDLPQAQERINCAGINYLALEGRAPSRPSFGSASRIDPVEIDRGRLEFGLVVVSDRLWHGVLSTGSR